MPVYCLVVWMFVMFVMFVWAQLGDLFVVVLDVVLLFVALVGDNVCVASSQCLAGWLLH